MSMNIVPQNPANETPAQNSALLSGILAFVQEARAAGLNVVPIRNKAYTGAWRHWQDKGQTDTEVRNLFTTTTQGVGVITGYGNIECLEWDDPDTFELFCDNAEGMGFDLVADLLTGWSDRSPNGGVHVYYRCDTVGGNTTLAKRPDPQPGKPNKTKTLIETRGAGGLVVVAPSHGNAHPTGKPYQLLSGGPSTMLTITPEQREELFAFARLFDEMPVKEAYVPVDRIQGSDHGDKVRPGDAYNASFSRDTWKQQLESDGWKFAYSHGEVDYYLRPGKEHVREGISATVNHGGKCRLRVFTTSTVLDEAMYSPFAYLAHWHHNGDFSAAGKYLYNEGYGDRQEQQKAVTGSITLLPRKSTETPDTTDAQVQALIEENNALRAQLEAQTALMMNPDLKDAPRRAGYRAIAIAASRQSQADDDGYVRMTAAEISNDYRPKPAKGEATPELNANGTRPYMKRQTVKTHMAALSDYLDVKEDKNVRKVHPRTGDAYLETEFLVRVTDPIAAIVDLAEYRSKKKRAAYGSQNKCQHCGEVHALTVRKYCGTPDDPGCGQQVAERYVPVPPQSRPIDEIDEAQIARLDERVTATESASTKNVEASSDATTTPLLNSMVTKNVEADSEPASTKIGEADDDAPLMPVCDWHIGEGEECGDPTEAWINAGYGSNHLCEYHANRKRNSGAPPPVTTSITIEGVAS